MASPDSAPVVVHEAVSCRFEILGRHNVAFAEYVRNGDALILTRTFVPPELRGRGFAEALVRAALDFARAERLRVVPECSYVAAFVERHPELSVPRS